MRFSKILRVVWGRDRDRGARRPSYLPGLTALEARTLLTTYTVTNTSSDFRTVGSLPFAVFQANYTTPGLDRINFNLPGAGPHVITVNQTLYINDLTVIDGTTQPGYAGYPVVSIRGTSSVPSIFLLQADNGTTSSGSTIQGLDMANYTANAVTIFASSSGDYIQKNWMGFYLDAAGAPHKTTDTFDQPTYQPTGIGIGSNYNTIDFNTISGIYNGIVMGGSTCQTNVIRDNNIGTDPTSTTSAGYGTESDGIFLGQGAQGNYIGPNNVSSGNASSGVELLDPSNTGNVIFGNRLGTNYAGTAAIPNGETGILIANGASGNTIGGPFGGNVIAGNKLAGISLGTSNYPGAVGNYVQYNIIGLNPGQSVVVGSENVGISIGPGATSNIIQTNVIGGQITNGIVVSASSNNDVTGNYIGQSTSGTPFANVDFGIALLPGASNNRFRSNTFGPSTYGNYYVDPGASGNQFQ